MGTQSTWGLGLVFQGIFCGKWHRIKTQAREKSGKPAKRQNRRIKKIKRIPTTRLRMSRKSPRDPRVAAVPQVAGKENLRVNVRIRKTEKQSQIEVLNWI